MHQDPSQLPSYSGPASSRSSLSRSRSPVEHSYNLLGRQNEPWATLRVHSNAASARFLPSYFEGQHIAGSLDLFLSKVDTIQSISLHLSGDIVATNVAPFTFWEMSTVLWSTEMGDPRAPTPPGQVKHSGKVQGAYRWNFSLEMPSDCLVSLMPKQPPNIVRLPPSFSEKGATQYINYQLYIWIRRGPLRIDSKLGTPFGYSPRTRPAPASMLRQLAYQEHSPLIGPEGDPDGWKVLPPMDIRGTLFGRRAVNATCTLALAVPLCYTRGSTIPCIMTVESRDREAVDLLAATTSPNVHLLRQIQYGAEQKSGKAVQKQSLKYATVQIASAVWWPTTEGGSAQPDGFKRRLDGEFHLPKDLQPSFVFGRFSLKYVVAILPFNATAYEPADQDPLLSETVDIVTSHAYGPIPRMYAPPGYDNLQKKPTTYGSYSNYITS